MSDKNENIDVILTQWQTCVDMANSVSQRRDTMNNIFVTVNLALLAAVSLTFELKSLFVLAIGVVICILWMIFIRNYKLLNTAKFKVIQELEEKLPTRPFQDEWKELCSSKKYKDGTKLEQILPIAFMVLYLTAMIIIIATKIKCK